MTQWDAVERIFDAALGAGDDRDALLARACAGDDALRAEVESLLAAHARTGAADRLQDDLSHQLRGAGPAIGDRLGRYTILERLGAGGMGLLFAAHDDRLDRTVALKLLPPALSADPAATRRFLLEARAAASLDHPNICAIHEIAETEDGRLFIAMPLYRGETLGERIARCPLPVADALELALTIARGLAHAHGRGIVHRDIKPANIFLPDDGAPRILDFGIAKVADLAITSTGAIVGTVPYMSPEQAGGGAVDHRSDLWSLGVVLFEMIVGQRPFPGPGLETTIAAILTAPAPPVTGVVGAGAANGVLERLLAKDPAERARDADAAAALLESALKDVRHGPMWEGATEGPPIAPEGERRQVAVLASHLGNYAELVERWAPEELERAVHRIRESAAAVIARHGGVLHRFTGDALVGLFGVPSTHEDDIARARRAAQDLHDWGSSAWLGAAEAPPLTFRSGVCAGSVVVQPDPATRSHRVAGDPLERALQLAGQAKAAEILVGPECQRLLESAERRSVTPFAGRDREFQQLCDARQAAARGDGECITVEAEAGAGKSRLLMEFARAARADDVRVVRAWCFTHELGAPPYLPWVAVLRDLLELGTVPASTLDAEMVSARMSALAPELADSLPFLLHLLGLSHASHPLSKDADGDRFRAAVADALASLLTLASRSRALVLVLEDWHWADAASHGVLKRLVELVPAYPVLVVVSYRPESGVEWPAALPRRAIRLGPLDAAASAQLIAAVLQAERIPDDVAQAIHERSGGNPFFVEELSHALAEQGAVRVRSGHAELASPVDTLHLPGTIQGVIRARLDRLDSGTREVARAASVAGRDFALSLVQQLVEADVALPRALERLRQAGLIHQTRVVPEPAYRFKHILTQEVIYDTLLVHRRRLLHARAGAALEALDPARRTEIADVLSFHFSRAESWTDAVRHGREEARQARAVSEYERALRVTDRLEGWAQRIPDEALRRREVVTLLLEQEALCETLGLRKRQQAILGRLLDVLDADSDPARLAEVYRRQGDLHILLRQFDEGRAALERSLEFSRAAEAPELERSALRSLGLLCWHAGRSRDGLPFLERALVIDRALGATDQVAHDLYNQGSLYKALGEWERALAVLDEAQQSALACGDLKFVPYIRYNVGIIHRLMGDNQRALAMFRETMMMDRSRGMWLELPFCACAIGNVLLDLGAVEDALASYREGVDIARRTHHADGLSQCQRILGVVLLGIGRPEEALPCLYEAVTVFAQLEDRETERDLWARIAAAEEGRGAFREAAAAWTRTRELRGAARDHAGELEAAGRAARTLRDWGGDPEAARAMFADALGLAARLEDQPAEGELRNAAGILEWRSGDFAGALAHYERALHLFRGLGDAAREGLALNSVGATLLCLQRTEEARGILEQAVARNRESGQRLLEGHALATLGDALLAAGEAAEAATRYEASLMLRRQIGDRAGEGWMLHRLSRAAEALGEPAAAEERRNEARRLAGALGDDELLRACEAAPMRAPAER